MKNIFFISIFLIQNVLLAQEFTSSNLPIVIINTNGENIVNEPKVTANMKIIFSEDGSRNFIDTDTYHYDGDIGIELRGQSSLNLFPKKGYGIETRKSDGSNKNVSLFGFPDENDWVIHSPYSDKSLLRNKITYDIAREIMPYAPRTQFCELIINDEYLGVIVFTEKIKQDKGRVDISKLKSEDISGDQLTGGYILKFDKANDNELAYTSAYKPDGGGWQDANFFFVYPKPENVQSAQKNFIRNFIREMENTLASESYQDSIDGYHKYIDPSTFIDFMIINELTRNVDGYRLSTYMYKDRDSIDMRLKMGPVWDFNLAIGNADYCNGSSISGWAYNFNLVCPDDFWVNHFWWKRLLSDPAFSRAFNMRWKELREGILDDENIKNRIDSYIDELDEAIPRNFEKWPILGQYIWPNNQVSSTYNGEVNYLQDWLLQRMEWIDENLNSINNGTPTSQQLYVFPNPSEGFVFYSTIDCERCTIEVYDIIGRNVTSAVNVQTDRINFSNLSGLYFVYLKNFNGEIESFTKVIVK